MLELQKPKEKISYLRNFLDYASQKSMTMIGNLEQYRYLESALKIKKNPNLHLKIVFNKEDLRVSLENDQYDKIIFHYFDERKPISENPKKIMVLFTDVIISSASSGNSGSSNNFKIISNF